MWVYFWKAARNATEENPSVFYYIDIADNSDDDDIKDMCESWASDDITCGTYYGYDYGWSRVTNPPLGWLKNRYREEVEQLSYHTKLANKIFEEICEIKKETHG